MSISNQNSKLLLCTVFLAIFTVGCVSKPPNGNITNLTITGNLTNASNINETANATKNLSACDGITDDFDRAKCFSETGNSTLCNNINETMEDIIYNCYLTSFQKEGANTAICNQSGTRADTCFAALAEFSGDYTLCNLIVSRSVDSCIENVAFIKANVSICNKLNGDDDVHTTDGCLNAFGQENHNLTICGEITSPEPRSVCFSEVLKYLAVENSNPGYCMNITDQVAQKDCYKYLSVAQGDPTICDFIKNKSEVIDCYVQSVVYNVNGIDKARQFFTEQINASVCTNTTNIINRDECFAAFGMVTGNMSFCETAERYVLPDFHFIVDRCKDYVARVT